MFFYFMSCILDNIVIDCIYYDYEISQRLPHIGVCPIVGMRNLYILLPKNAFTLVNENSF